MNVRVALSGIPASWMRNVRGKSAALDTLYNEFSPPVRTVGNLKHEIKRIANTGNYMIGEGARRCLRVASQQFFPLPWFSQPDGDRLIDHVNKNFDKFVFCCANVFNPSFQPDAEVGVLSKINIPIVFMSAGIQVKSSFSETYPEQFRPLIALMKRSNVFTITRGLETKAFLKKQGVVNVEAAGCPSLFAYPDNFTKSFKRLKAVEFDKLNRVLYSGYLGSVTDSITDANSLYIKGQYAAYCVQDEPNIFRYEISAPAEARAYDEATGEIVASVDFPGKDKLAGPLHQFVFFNGEQWRSWCSQFDFTLARRFHGGVAAAQAGVPAIWLAVDDRTREMLSFAKLPFLESTVWNQVKQQAEFLADYRNSLVLDELTQGYTAAHRNFNSILRNLGLRS